MTEIKMEIDSDLEQKYSPNSNADPKNVDKELSIHESNSNLIHFADIKAKIANGQYTTFTKIGKSRVWDVYDGILDANGIEMDGIVTCKKCNNIFKLTKKSTSNLLKHKCYIFIMSKRNNSEPAVEVRVDTKKKCVCVATEWAVGNCRSFKIIEDSGLKKFASFLISVGAEYGRNVQLETLLPHPSTLSTNVGILYEKYFDEIKLELGEIKKYGFGITADMWTENYLNISYLVVTIHYVKDGELKNRLLALRSMEGEKLTGENIKFKVSQTLAAFNCELNDNAIIVTDRDANMISAFHTCNHICCINYLLHNAVEKSLKETPEIIDLCNTCSKLLKYLKKSGISLELQTTLKSFSPTRWNAVFCLLSSIGKNWNDIITILQEKNEMQRIDNINLSTIDDVAKVLSYFDEASKMLEGENYVTLHWVYIYIHRIQKKCIINQRDPDVVRALKEKLNFYLNEVVLKNINIYHKIALFLFPPTNKLKQFTETEKTVIKKECKNLMRSYVESVRVDDCNIPSTSNISSFNFELLSDFVEESYSLKPDDKVKHEIRVYENTDVEFRDDFNVLQWWDSHKGEFPLLHKVSCKVLAIPASSAASERIFSMARKLFFEKKSVIESNLATVNQILFLHCNSNKTNINSEVERIYN